VTSLEVTTLTLPFDPLLGGFPNERLRDYLHERELLHGSAARPSRREKLSWPNA
jgi:hypothetical protein